jgi:tetratricopeptide (TPR) repeat protein
VRADSIVGAFYLDADRSVRRRIGQYWALTGRDEHAVPVFERLVREDSLDAVARYFLGRSLVMLAREPRRAQEHLAYAAGISDSGREREYDIEQALWRLGQAYRQLGVLDSARVNFERALYQRPGYRPARRSLDSLRLR